MIWVREFGRARLMQGDNGRQHTGWKTELHSGSQASRNDAGVPARPFNRTWQCQLLLDVLPLVGEKDSSSELNSAHDPGGNGCDNLAIIRSDS
ncbi:MAG: hypothetical protein ACK5WR_21320 [Planctomycetaceae bacterium]